MYTQLESKLVLGTSDFEEFFSQAMLVADELEDGPEPDRQGLLGPIEQAPGRQGGLMTAARALHQPTLDDGAGPPAAAGGAAQAVWPLDMGQVLPPGPLGREATFELQHRCGEVGQVHRGPPLVSLRPYTAGLAVLVKGLLRRANTPFSPTNAILCCVILLLSAAPATICQVGADSDQRSTADRWQPSAELLNMAQRLVDEATRQRATFELGGVDSPEYMTTLRAGLRLEDETALKCARLLPPSLLDSWELCRATHLGPEQAHPLQM
jgi:hypothetical protein